MERVVLLIDGHRHPVGRIGYLADGIDNQSVVLGPIVAGHHIQAVADVKERCQIIFIGSGILLRQILRAQFLCQSLHLSRGGLIECGKNAHIRFREGQILAFRKHGLHHLGSQRCPGAVFNQSNRTVAEIPFRQVMDKFLHKGKNIRVVGGCSQHQFVVTESISNRLSHVTPGKIMNNHLGAAVGPELGNQIFRGCFGVSVHAGVSNDNAFTFHGIGGPNVIELQIVTQILCQHGAMERANGLNIQCGSLFQQILHLSAIFAHNADIITAGLVIPGLLHIQSAKLAKAVGGEQDLIRAIIGHNNFGPMHHRRRYKGQRVLTQGQGAHFPYHNPAVLKAGAEKGAHHGECLGGGNNCGFREDLHKVGDVGGMVRLHMLNNQIIRLSALEHILDVVQPFMGEILVHRIHDRDLFVQNHVGIVGHAIGNPVLTLKQVHLMIIDTHIANIIRNVHNPSPL